MLAVAANPPEPGDGAPTTTCQLGVAEPVAVLRAVRVGARSTSRRTRCPSAAAASDQGPRVEVPRQPRASSGCCGRAERVDRRRRARSSPTCRSPSACATSVAARRPRQGRASTSCGGTADLYGVYTEAEVIYTDDRTLELFSSLDAAGPGDVPVRRRDGRLAVLPAGRALPGRDAVGSARSRARPRASRRCRSASASSWSLALFDMEGTIIPSNVVESYVWTRMADLPRDEWPTELASVFSRIPVVPAWPTGATGASSCGRSSAGTRARAVEGIDRLVERASWPSSCCRRSRAAAIRRIREHRAAGHRTILITAAAEPFVRPLAPLFDEVIAAKLEVARRALHGLPGRAARSSARRARPGSAGTPSWRAST